MTRRRAAAPEPGLIFYPASHRYKLDGQWVPGVTTIIGVLDKPALRKWAARSVAEFVADNPDEVYMLGRMGRNAMVNALREVPWKKRDDAADRGSEFHEYAEAILLGQEVEVPENRVGMVNASLDFMDDWKIAPVLTEYATASRKHRHAGTGDLVADYVHPRTGRKGRGIFDWKSSRAIYASTAFQNAAYGFSEFWGLNGDEHPMSDLGIEHSFGVHIRDDGYTVHPLPYGQDIYDEFVVIRNAYDIHRRSEGDWKRPGSGYVGLGIEPAD